MNKTYFVFALLFVFVGACGGSSDSSLSVDDIKGLWVEKTMSISTITNTCPGTVELSTDSYLFIDKISPNIVKIFSCETSACGNTSKDTYGTFNFSNDTLSQSETLKQSMNVEGVPGCVGTVTYKTWEFSFINTEIGTEKISMQLTFQGEGCTDEVKKYEGCTRTINIPLKVAN